MTNEHAEGSTFDAVVRGWQRPSDKGQEMTGASLMRGRLSVTWGIAALTSLFVAFGSLMVAITIADAREFGWPSSRPSDQLAQMNLDESLLGLPLFGLPTALLVVIYASSLFFIARNHLVAGWILPSATVMAAGVAPIVWAFTL